MKKTMRFISLVIAVFMICSLTTAAFAADNHDSHTINIYNSQSGYEYTAYKVFTGDLGADGVLANIEWGSDIDTVKLINALKAEDAFKDCEDAEDVANVLSANSATDNPTAIRFAEIVADCVSAAGTPAAPVDGVYKINGLTDGYYLVVNTKTPDGAVNTTVSRYMLQVVRDVHVDHKGTFPTVTKKILEGSEKVNVNEASIGEVVNYQIMGTLPSNIADYDSYFYWFRDTLSKGLTYNGDIQILMDLDGSSTTSTDTYDVTQYFAIYVKGGNGADTEIHASVTDALALDNLSTVTGTISGHTRFVISYTATLNEYAVVDGPNPNTIDLVYSNNPNDDGTPSTEPPTPPETPTEEPKPTVPTGKTPESKVETYTTQLIVEKVDGQGKILKGAEFELTGTGVYTTIVTKQVLTDTTAEPAPEGATMYYLLKDGTYTETAPVTVDDPSTPDINEINTDSYVKNADDSISKNWYLKDVKTPITVSENVTVKAFVGDNGLVTFTGLGAGKYTLSETTTPSGFNTIDDIKFEIFFNDETKTWSVDHSDINFNAANHYFWTTVVNVKGNTLPSTGGIGTTIFYIFGGLMVAGAAVLLITKKRMAA